LFFIKYSYAYFYTYSCMRVIKEKDLDLWVSNRIGGSRSKWRLLEDFKSSFNCFILNIRVRISIQAKALRVIKEKDLDLGVSNRIGDKWMWTSKEKNN
jgi:hypothetical protein